MERPGGEGRTGDRWAIVGIGATVTLAGLGLLVATGFAADSTAQLLVRVLLLVGLGGAATVIGARLARSELTGTQLRYAVRWCLGGLLGLVVLAVLSDIDTIRTAGVTTDVVRTLLIGSNLGVLFGVVAGANRAQTVQNRQLLDRTAEQREALMLLNHLLRHHVLNAMNIVGAYAGGEETEESEVVRRQTDRVVTLVENVRVLTRALTEETDTTPVALEEVLRAELETARLSHPEADIESDVPEGVTVLASAALGPVFGNLLRNAVEHSDSEDPTVRVTVEEHDETVTVRVADDGPGIPDEQKTAYAGPELPDQEMVGESLGLYLVVTLVRQWDGSVDIADNEPRGTVVSVTLPRPAARPRRP